MTPRRRIARSSLTGSGCQQSGLGALAASVPPGAPRRFVFDEEALDRIAPTVARRDVELDDEPRAASFRRVAAGEALPRDIQPLSRVGPDVPVALHLVEPGHGAAH